MTQRENRPNILLITTDEQRYDTYGSTASDWPQPQNLAQLRRESTTLTNAYSNSPLCMPCRYSWITGLYPSQTEQGPCNGHDWPHTHPTMPQALQAAGYHTALIGKLHAHSGHTLEQHHMNELEPHTRALGFDTVYECSGRSLWSFRCTRKQPLIRDRYTDHLQERGLYERALRENREREVSRSENGGIEPYRSGVLEAPDTLDGFVSERMCRFIREHDASQPFFLHASFWGPHYPLDVPREYFDRHRPEDMPPPRNIRDPDLIRRWQENRAMYMGLTDLVDARIGRLLEALRERGLMDNTVILFTTDHGDMLGDDGFARKIQPHEGSCRTPILVRDPGVAEPGRVLPGLVEGVDLPQTILAAAGLDEQARAEALPLSPGFSFRDYLQTGGETFRDSAYAEVGDASMGSTIRMIRRGGWKYSRHASRNKRFDRLYYLDRDPAELNNLADDPDHAGQIRDLQGRLIDRMAAVRRPPSTRDGS